MIIHNYDNKTGEFLNTIAADESPLEEEVYLIPANATDVQPPAVEEKQIACFLNGAWVIKEDNRGLEYYAPNGESKTIYDLDETVPANHTTTPPPDKNMEWNGSAWAYDIEALRARQLNALKTAANAALEPLTANYSNEEQKSWGKQEEEARAYTADNAAATPFIDNYAAAAAMTKADIVASIMAKVTTLEADSGTVVGQIKAKRAALKSAATADEILAVSLVITA